MRIDLALDEKSVSKAIKKIQEYQKDLIRKNKLFAEKLSDIGIKVAQDRASQSSAFNRYVTFTKEIKDENGKIETLIIGKGETTISRWKSTDGIREVEVSPLLFLEFGAGNLAENPLGIDVVGQGTLNTYGHAYDENGWYFKTLEGKWVHSYGYAPHQPMYGALQEMIEQVETVAREVFRNG